MPAEKFQAHVLRGGQARRAVVSATSPIPFAVREPLPGVVLDDVVCPGLGVALWLAAEQPQQLHDALESTGVPLLKAPENVPYGLNFTFADPDGFAVTVHGDA